MHVLGIRIVTIYRYDDINMYDYHTVYICLSMVFGEKKDAGADSPASHKTHLRLGNNFPLNCSLAPPTRAAETTPEKGRYL